ncbi:hypothetical protein J2X65_003570 [Ancylobacter sp. 3268]|uniref:HNH endonuclease n=1 Tax=Ancylobacter sp. 3268 TaxID=2817752 RepID=UPI00285B9E88|nr:HNH endonuclease [Ancylobacter sp. 3268]MDR6954202.1 hypothetical protein [Ancylobacter sp. 3268]
MFLKMFRSDAAIEQGRRCAYCTEPMLKVEFTADHVMPRSRGGTTKRENIKACCGACNRAKGSMSVKAFMSVISYPPKGASLAILRAHMRRRIWRRAHLACQRIERAAGITRESR